VLALTARGLGTCIQVAIAGYPEILREQLDISEQFTILCGLSIGYADPDFPANKIRVGREPTEKNVVFLDG
jgi:nitroreductase